MGGPASQQWWTEFEKCHRQVYYKPSEGVSGVSCGEPARSCTNPQWEEAALMVRHQQCFNDECCVDAKSRKQKL